MKRILSILAVALGLGLAAPAHAAPRKKAKPAQKAAASDQKKPVAAQPRKTDEREGPAKLSSPSGPSGDWDMEEMADKKRDEEINQLKKIIPKIPRDNPQRADLLFRLAERWYDKSKFVYFQEVRDYDKAYAAFMAAQQKGDKQAREPKLTTTHSDQLKREAMRLYQQILDDYPDYGRNDEVLFNLAYNSYETGDKKQGVQHYYDLIKRYPKSDFVPDAYLQMGEHFFSTNDLSRAKYAYEKAYASQKPRIKGFALYKLAWCDYNAGDFEGSLSKFKQVVDYSEQAAKGEKDRIQLKGEAMRDMVRSYVALDTVEPASTYWGQHTSRERARELTKKLAMAFFDAGKFEDSIQTYQLLQRQAPNDPDAPTWQNGVVLAYDKLNRTPDVKREINRLVDLYKPGSEWAKVNANNKHALAVAYELGEESMRQIVTDYHSLAQKTKSVETYRAARDIYAKYLDSYADSEHAYMLRFYYAEILYTLQEWEKAAEQYEAVVAMNTKDGQYLKAAAYDTILCWEKLVNISKGLEKQTELASNQKIDESKAKGTVKRAQKLTRHEKGAKEEEIPKYEQKLVAACDRYVQVVPHAEDEITVRYKAAFVFYDHRHDVDAAKRFGDIIVKWPGDQWSRKAADLTLDILNTKEEWADLNRLAREFAANKKLVGGDRDFSGRLAALIEGSQFKLTMATYEKEKDYPKAAGQFRAFVKEFPKSQYADKALYNAMVIYDQGKELDQAIPLAEQLVKDYKDSPLSALALGSLGNFYERIADFKRAAEEYEKYAETYGPPGLFASGSDDLSGDEGGAKGRGKAKARKPEPKKVAARGKKGAEKKGALDPKIAEAVPDHLYNAAFWFEGTGDFARAIKDYARYIHAFPDRKDVPDLFFNVGLVYERQADHKHAARIFDAFASKYAERVTSGRVFFAKYKALLDEVEDGGDPLKPSKDTVKLAAELLKEYGNLAQDEQQKPTAMNAAGHLAFMVAQPEFDDFVRIKFDNPKTLKKALKAKLEAMKLVEDTYTGVIKYGSPEYGIASLVRIGQAYQDFARNFTDSPDPKGLDPDQLDMYRAELENRAFPLEGKAVEAYEKALAKSYELSFYDQWTLDAQDRLNKFKPGQYGDVRKVPFQGSEFFAEQGPDLELKGVDLPKDEPAAPPAQPAARAAGAGGN